jgi:REP element-mobilizing transposase RayT
VHVTLRLVHGVASLRRKVPYRLIKHAMAQTNRREGFRLVHFSVLANHMHLIVEADDRDTLARGIQGLEIRIAHRINRLERRRGRLFRDRYHAHALKTPREVRNAIAYVVLNARHHAHDRGVELPKNWIDPYASGDYFDGWRRWIVEPRDPIDAVIGAPVRPPTQWLLTTGWRARGLIALDEVPALRNRHA